MLHRGICCAAGWSTARLPAAAGTCLPQNRTRSKLTLKQCRDVCHSSACHLQGCKSAQGALERSLVWRAPCNVMGGAWSAVLQGHCHLSLLIACGDAATATVSLVAESCFFEFPVLLGTGEYFSRPAAAKDAAAASCWLAKQRSASPSGRCKTAVWQRVLGAAPYRLLQAFAECTGKENRLGDVKTLAECAARCASNSSFFLCVHLTLIAFANATILRLATRYD